MNDGRMILKLIQKVDRYTIQAVLSRDEKNGKDIAIYRNKYIFILNQAAVAYFK